MIPLTKSDRDKLHSKIKAMNEHIAAILEKLHDKSDKKIKKQLQPISVQITELSSKQSESIQNEVLTITSENLSYEYNFEIKFKDKISPYNQIFE